MMKVIPSTPDAPTNVQVILKVNIFYGWKMNFSTHNST